MLHVDQVDGPAVEIPGVYGAARKKGFSDAICRGESLSYGMPPETANLTVHLTCFAHASHGTSSSLA